MAIAMRWVGLWDEASGESAHLGDIVRLKSGGPRMTVDRVDYGVISCVWFCANNELRRADITELLLEVELEAK